MAEIHILNVGEGNCVIFKSNSGHVSVYDICCGNIEEETKEAKIAIMEKAKRVSGNFQMCKHPTNPINFLNLNNS